MIIQKKRSKYNEFYLYMNGELIYKKWLNEGYSKVFDIMAYDKYTHCSYTDLDIKDSPFLIKVKAEIKLLKASEGGRSLPVFSRYRPNHVFEYNEQNGEMIEVFMGEINFNHTDKLELGTSHEVEIWFVLSQKIEKFLERGRIWWLHEANHLVGEAEIIDFIYNEMT